MSDDLISRSVLLQKMHENKELLKEIFDMDAEYACMSVDSVIEKIKSIPTAYDVDKVVKQLEEKREKHRKDAHVQMYKHKNEDWAQYLDGMQCGIRDSIKIVKSGGIE